MAIIYSYSYADAILNKLSSVNFSSSSMNSVTF